jgi:hypothetical protein
MGNRLDSAARGVLAGVTLLCLSIGTASAKDGWKPLTGKECPPFRVEQWLNTDADPQPSDLVGKVWMLELLSVG